MSQNDQNYKTLMAFLDTRTQDLFSNNSYSDKRAETNTVQMFLRAKSQLESDIFFDKLEMLSIVGFIVSSDIVYSCEPSK